MFSLTCGTIIDLGIARYAGKGQGEVTLLRKLASVFSAGDVLLGDCLVGNWRCLYEFQQRGVGVVTRLNRSRRAADFRKGERLGKEDHLIEWPKPWIKSVDREVRKSMPEFITVREARVHINQPGFRTKVMVVVTTLLDHKQYSKDDLAELYRQRWNAELDLRTLKQTLQMDVLRCKTPSLVRKEIWTHILAYNLIRTIMAQVAVEYDRQPRSVSFTATLQTLKAFQPLIAGLQRCDQLTRQAVYAQLLEAIATHKVANRPGRFEPRAKKTPHSRHSYLQMPRHEAKRRMAKGLGLTT